jgi:hypothetical protein
MLCLEQLGVEVLAHDSAHELSDVDVVVHHEQCSSHADQIDATPRDLQNRVRGASGEELGFGPRERLATAGTSVRLTKVSWALMEIVLRDQSPLGAAAPNRADSELSP